MKHILLYSALVGVMIACLAGCAPDQTATSTTTTSAATTTTVTEIASTTVTTTTVTAKTTTTAETTTVMTIIRVPTTTTTAPPTTSSSRRTVSRPPRTTTTVATKGTTVMKTSGDFKCYVWASGEAVTIDRYVGTAKDVVIPSEIDGLPVKSIDSVAFMSTDIESVVIPDSVEAIGPSAFCNCQQLHTVTMSKNVKYIYYDAFMKCRSLKSIELPSGLEEIWMSAFQESGLTSVTIPNTVTKIGHQAFMGSPLTSVIFEDGLQTISGDAAFWCGENLLSVTIPASVTRLEARLFNDKIKEAHFLGDAPSVDGSSTFGPQVVLYRRADAKGWEESVLSQQYTVKIEE